MLFRLIRNTVFFAAQVVWLWFYTESWINFGVGCGALFCFWTAITSKPEMLSEIWKAFSCLGRLCCGVMDNLSLALYKDMLINTKSINLNPELLAAGCDQLVFPNNIRVHKFREGIYDIEIKRSGKLFNWHNFQGLSFAITISTGEIERIRIDTGYVWGRGAWLRNGSQTEWPKYYNSVVMAHIEVLKFSGQKTRQLSVVHRIFKHYGQDIFVWILAQQA